MPEKGMQGAEQVQTDIEYGEKMNADETEKRGTQPYSFIENDFNEVLFEYPSPT